MGREGDRPEELCNRLLLGNTDTHTLISSKTYRVRREEKDETNYSERLRVQDERAFLKIRNFVKICWEYRDVER